MVQGCCLFLPRSLIFYSNPVVKGAPLACHAILVSLDGMIRVVAKQRVVKNWVTWYPPSFFVCFFTYFLFTQA